MAKEKNGFTGEYHFYVGVLYRDNEIRFVDTVDYGDKSATWRANCTPMVFDKRSAIELQVGLCCNGHVALVVEAPDFLELKNKAVYEQ